MEPHWISPKYEKSHFTLPLSFDQKVEIFRDRIDGWQLNIAKECQHIQHAGFGVLYICLSYFEMVARFRAGDTSIYKSREFFRRGFRAFARGKPIAVSPHFNTVVDLLYEGARCGLYHISTTAQGVYISGDRPDSLTYDAGLKRLVIHPGKLIEEIVDDFKKYVTRLSKPGESLLRTNFERKFDHDILPQIT